MESSNLPPFYIGQKVVYITGKFMQKHSIHIVLDVIQFSCGHWAIRIGNHNAISPTGRFRCHCNDKIIINIGSDIWEPKSFRSYEEQNFPLIKLSQIKEQELCAN